MRGSAKSSAVARDHGGVDYAMSISVSFAFLFFEDDHPFVLRMMGLIVNLFFGM
jgi:hypothetical protein